MSEQDPTKTAGGEQPQGLGFAKLSMNEIAPAVVTEPAKAAARRTGKTWLIALGAVIILVGAWFGVRSALNFPPPPEVQQAFQDTIAASPYGQEGTVVLTKFLNGTSLEIQFSPTLSTMSFEQRTVLRQATTFVLKAMAKAVPERELTVTGLQGETKIVEAHYSPSRALSGDAKSDELDVTMWVKDGEEDGIGEMKQNTSRPTGAGVAGE